jgi:hypothetical protein
MPDKEPDYDPFDPKNLLVNQDFVETASVKKLITNIPIKKPDKQVFFRIHPSKTVDENGAVTEWTGVFHVIDLKNDREQYVVGQRIAKELASEVVKKQFRLGVTAQGDLFLMPIGLPEADGKDNTWWISLREVCDIAESKWVRAIPNQSVKGYDVFHAKDTLPEPDWKELLQKLKWWDLIKIAFKNYFRPPDLRRV